MTKPYLIMLTLLIPSPTLPGKDMDVFLRPLVDEFNELLFEGVSVCDAHTNKIFNICATLLWTMKTFLLGVVY